MKIFVHPSQEPGQEGPVLILRNGLQDSADLHQRIERLQDTIRCAADWLHRGAPWQALAVLEENMP